MSRVDVIVPCYRYAHLLEACVRSVLDQPGVDVRVLILDDTSPDDTPEVCARLSAADRRVSFRRHAVNQGHIATYNEGIDWLEGEYALLLSADDLVTPGALGRAARLMDAHPDVALTYGGEVTVRTSGPLPPIPPVADPDGYTILTGPAFLEHVCTLASNPVPTPSAIVRTEVQKRVGGYRADLPHSGDLEMWLRFGAHGSVGVLNGYQAYYRKHDANMALQYPWLKDFEQRKAAFDAVLDRYADRIPDAARLQVLATRRLAEVALQRAHNAHEQGDLAAARDLQAFARRVWPGVASSRAWSRLEWKRRLGPLLPLLGPLARRLRGA